MDIVSGPVTRATGLKPGYACSLEGRGTSSAMTAPAARNAAPTGSAAVSPAANDDGVA